MLDLEPALEKERGQVLASVVALEREKAMREESAVALEQEKGPL